MNLEDKLGILYDIDTEVFELNLGDKKSFVQNLSNMIHVTDILVGKYRTEIKEVYSCINHDRPYDSSNAELKQYYKLIKRLESKCGLISVSYNTFIRLINGYTLSQAEIKTETEYLQPKAYDRSLVCQRKSELVDLHNELFDYIRNGKGYFMNDLRHKMKTWKLYKGKSILCNGSHMDSIRGHVITDTLSQLFKPSNPDWTKDADVILNYFNDKDWEYILYDTDFLIKISMIPDSNLKIRIVYRIVGYISRALKFIHKDLDPIARSLEGNSTYDQTGWLIELLNNGYHKNGCIVSTDMSAYSDTLELDMILEVLKLRYPDIVVDAIRGCFQSIAYDERHGVYYGTNEYNKLLSSLQGLFSDFPCITLCNLIIQDFIYHKLGFNSEDSVLSVRNSAVGDDTGMRYPCYQDSIMETIVDCYNCVGVNINEEKTHILINGNGFIDFVKLKLSSNGIGWSFSGTGLIKYPRSTLKEDVFYRDICNLFNNLRRYSDLRYYDRLVSYLNSNDDLKFLMDVSLINGGLKNDPIELSDIKLFMYRFYNMKYTGDDLKEHLPHEFYNEVRTLDWIRSHLSLSKSVLSQLIPDDCEVTDDLVYLTILNCSKIGYLSIEDVTKIDLPSLIGKLPSQIRDNWKHGKCNSTEEFILSYPLIPSFGKTKIKNAYEKLKQMLTTYSYSGFDLSFRFYSNGFKTTMDLQDFKSSFESRIVMWSKIYELVKNYCNQNHNLEEHCVFGSYYYYCYYKGKKYIIGLHDYSMYPSIPNEMVEEVLGYYGYLDTGNKPLVS